MVQYFPFGFIFLFSIVFMLSRSEEGKLKGDWFPQTAWGYMVVLQKGGTCVPTLACAQAALGITALGQPEIL